VNGVEACKKKGVGLNWKAYVIFSLSVAEGACGVGHPTKDEVLWFRAKYVRVFENITYLRE